MPAKQLTQREIDREVDRSAYVQEQGRSNDARWVTVVVARNAADYQRWCDANGKSAHDRNFLMATPASVRNLHEARLEITTEGMWRPDIHQVMTALVPMLEKNARKKLETMGWGGQPPALH